MLEIRIGQSGLVCACGGRDDEADLDLRGTSDLVFNYHYYDNLHLKNHPLLHQDSRVTGIELEID